MPRGAARRDAPLMRRLLDGLYAAGAALAACALFGIFAVMIAQIVLREAGVQFAGADDLTAYLCVAATFFALASTLRRGEMIRVGMLIQRVGPRVRRVMEGIVLLAGIGIVGTILWWTTQDMLFSWQIEEVAQGTVPFLLWVPKLAMPLGAGLLLLALVDELVTLLRGGTPAHVAEAAARAAAQDHAAEA